MKPDSCNKELSWVFVIKHPPVEKDHKDILHVYILFDVISALKNERMS